MSERKLNAMAAHRRYSPIPVIAVLVIISTVAYADTVDVTWSQNQAVTIAGDGNGIEQDIAFGQGVATDGQYAKDINSGTGPCGGILDPACACGLNIRDQHRFWSWGLAPHIPASASNFSLQVILNAKADSHLSSPQVFMRIGIYHPETDSYTWGTCRSVGLTGSPSTFTVPLSPDTWGLTLTRDLLISDNLRLEITSAATSGARDFFYDFIALRVHFVVPTHTFTPTVTGTINTPTVTPTRTPTPQGGDLVVNTTDDCDDMLPGDGYCRYGPGDSTTDCRCCYYAAIQESNALGGIQRILIMPGTYKLTRDPPVITESAIFEGLGQTASAVVFDIAGKTSRLANQAAGTTVTWRNLTVSSDRNYNALNPRTPQLGGCYYAEQQTDASFVDVVFDRCLAMRDRDDCPFTDTCAMGGAIFMTGPNSFLRLQRTLFWNTMANLGAGVALRNNAHLYVSDSYFFGSQAQGFKIAGPPCGSTSGGGSHIFAAGSGRCCTDVTASSCKNPEVTCLAHDTCAAHAPFSTCAGYTEIAIDRTTFELGVAFGGLGGGILMGDNQGLALGSGSGPDQGGVDYGVGGRLRITNSTLHKNRARRGRCSGISAFSSWVQLDHVTIHKNQAKCSSVVCMHNRSRLEARNTVISNHNTSGPIDDGPSTGHPMCWDDGTASYALSNTMDDSNPPGTNYNDEKPTPCPSATPVGNACLPASASDGGAFGPTLRPLLTGCVSTRNGDILGLTDGISPLVDMGSVIDGITTDQRGKARNVDYSRRPGTGPDIGAYEVQAGE